MTCNVIPIGFKLAERDYDRKLEAILGEIRVHEAEIKNCFLTIEDRQRRIQELAQVAQMINEMKTLLKGEQEQCVDVK